jgi:hypothetical protein
MRNDYETLELTRRDDHILVGKFDRPEAANAMNTQVGREARIYQAAPISTNLILACVGQHVLGLPRSY